MTQEERLLKRINSIDSPGLYEIIVYVTAEKTIAFWLVKRHEVEGEQKKEKCDKIELMFSGDGLTRRGYQKPRMSTDGCP